MFMLNASVLGNFVWFYLCCNCIFFLGGSLAALVAQDECLSEEVVREFSIDLMKGLKYIHDSGIVVSDLTPAKVEASFFYQVVCF